MKKVVFPAMLGLLAMCMLAEAAPFQISMTPDFALRRRTTHIRGFSVGFWNENPGTQFQFGVINGAKDESKGVQWGFLHNYADTFSGAQLGFVNRADDMRGVQWGAINMAREMKGLQFGWVNYARTPEKCLQVGLVNLMPESEWFARVPREFAPVSPFVNWRF